MDFKTTVLNIRKQLNMTQQQFAEEFGVSKQAVQKWESGVSYPEVSKIIETAKRFDISLDSLLLDRDMRVVEEIRHKTMTPDYSGVLSAETYFSGLMDEYKQCVDEGLDMEAYKDILAGVSKLLRGEIKKRFADVIFELL